MENQVAFESASCLDDISVGIDGGFEVVIRTEPIKGCE